MKSLCAFLAGMILISPTFATAPPMGYVTIKRTGSCIGEPVILRIPKQGEIVLPEVNSQTEVLLRSDVLTYIDVKPLHRGFKTWFAPTRCVVNMRISAQANSDPKQHNTVFIEILNDGRTCCKQ